jgi:hypothetical protein
MFNFLPFFCQILYVLPFAIMGNTQGTQGEKIGREGQLDGVPVSPTHDGLISLHFKTKLAWKLSRSP